MLWRSNRANRAFYIPLKKNVPIKWDKITKTSMWVW
uniref:Uncharacterized protein n=1 Tax=Anguilla anguilla TaxID=7936 RepID=A0A0E9STX7_ANGAN